MLFRVIRPVLLPFRRRRVPAGSRGRSGASAPRAGGVLAIAFSVGLTAAPLAPGGGLLGAAPAQAREVSAAQTAAGFDVALLQDRLNRALNTSGASLVGAAVDVAGIGPVLRRNAEAALLPASNQKSFLGLAALRLFGPEARFRTDILRTAGLRPDGVMPGHLQIIAGGDPLLTAGVLNRMARDIRAAGVRVVAGHILLDDSRYDRRLVAPGWKAGWMPRFVGPLSAFAVNGNRYRTDSLYLQDPAIRNALLFRDLLIQNGVEVRGQVFRYGRLPGAVPIATWRSHRMADIVKQIMEPSDNFASELLLKELGLQVRGRGTSADGVLAMRSLLPGVQVGPSADGSGLSQLNRQTPASQIQLLSLARNSDVYPWFVRALPIACREGTLEKRLCGTAAEGVALAKTGTLSTTRALSGYTFTADGRLVMFAFQLQGIRTGRQATDAMDLAVEVLSLAR